MDNTTQPISDPYVLADLLESSGLLSPQTVRTFCCACCQLIWTDIPTIAQEALSIAEAYLQHQVSDDVLVATRVKLWSFLDQDTSNLAAPTVNAIRAVICCLYPDASMHKANDLYETLATTIDFCNAVIPYREQQLQLLRKIFQTSQ
jgi:hypothetical protein